MKKIFSILALAGIISLTTFSVTRAQEASGGIKGGLTMSNLYIDHSEIDDENARFGFNVGLFSQIMFLETIGIQPELLFTTKGTKATYEGFISQTVDFNMNYLDVPVFVVFRPVEIVELYIGPYVGLLLSSNIKYSGAIDGYDEIDRDNFNTIDYGFGAGFALNFGNVSTGLRYNVGLQKLADSNVSEMLLGESKNAYGQLYIAFRFSE